MKFSKSRKIHKKEKVIRIVLFIVDENRKNLKRLRGRSYIIDTQSLDSKFLLVQWQPPSLQRLTATVAVGWRWWGTAGAYLHVGWILGGHVHVQFLVFCLRDNERSLGFHVEVFLPSNMDLSWEGRGHVWRCVLVGSCHHGASWHHGSGM